MPGRSDTPTLQCFPNDKLRAIKKPFRKLIMKLAGCRCFDAIFVEYCSKVQRQLTIKVVDNKSYASKCRPVGSRHHILGCISARNV